MELNAIDVEARLSALEAAVAAQCKANGVSAQAFAGDPATDAALRLAGATDRAFQLRQLISGLPPAGEGSQ